VSPARITAKGVVTVSTLGYLLSVGLAPTHIFLSACVFALIAALATALLAFRGEGAEMLTAQKAAQ